MADVFHCGLVVVLSAVFALLGLNTSSTLAELGDSAFSRDSSLVFTSVPPEADEEETEAGGEEGRAELSFSPMESDLCQAGVMVKRTLDVSSPGAEGSASLLMAVAESQGCLASSSSAFSTLSPGSSAVDMLSLASTVDGGR